MDSEFGTIIADSFKRMSKLLNESTILEIRNIGELCGEVLLHVLPKGIYMVVGSVTKFIIVLLLAYLIAIGFFIMWEATLSTQQQSRLGSAKENAKMKTLDDATAKADKSKDDEDTPKSAAELPNPLHNSIAGAESARLSDNKLQSLDATAKDEAAPAPQLSVDDLEKLLNEIKKVDEIEVPPAEIKDEELNKILSDSENPRSSKENQRKTVDGS